MSIEIPTTLSDQSASWHTFCEILRNAVSLIDGATTFFDKDVTHWLDWYYIMNREYPLRFNKIDGLIADGTCSDSKIGIVMVKTALVEIDTAWQGYLKVKTELVKAELQTDFSKFFRDVIKHCFKHINLYPPSTKIIYSKSDANNAIKRGIQYATSLYSDEALRFWQFQAYLNLHQGKPEDLVVPLQQLPEAFGDVENVDIGAKVGVLRASAQKIKKTIPVKKVADTTRKAIKVTNKAAAKTQELIEDIKLPIEVSEVEDKPVMKTGSVTPEKRRRPVNNNNDDDEDYQPLRRTLLVNNITGKPIAYQRGLNLRSAPRNILPAPTWGTLGPSKEQIQQYKRKQAASKYVAAKKVSDISAKEKTGKLGKLEKCSDAASAKASGILYDSYRVKVILRGGAIWINMRQFSGSRESGASSRSKRSGVRRGSTATPLPLLPDSTVMGLPSLPGSPSGLLLPLPPLPPLPGHPVSSVNVNTAAGATGTGATWKSPLFSIPENLSTTPFSTFQNDTPPPPQQQQQQSQTKQLPSPKPANKKDSTKMGPPPKPQAPPRVMSQKPKKYGDNSDFVLGTVNEGLMQQQIEEDTQMEIDEKESSGNRLRSESGGSKALSMSFPSTMNPSDSTSAVGPMGSSMSQNQNQPGSVLRNPQNASIVNNPFIQQAGSRSGNAYTNSSSAFTNTKSILPTIPKQPVKTTNSFRTVTRNSPNTFQHAVTTSILAGTTATQSFVNTATDFRSSSIIDNPTGPRPETWEAYCKLHPSEALLVSDSRVNHLRPRHFITPLRRGSDISMADAPPITAIDRTLIEGRIFEFQEAAAEKMREERLIRYYEWQVAMLQAEFERGMWNASQTNDSVQKNLHIQKVNEVVATMLEKKKAEIQAELQLADYLLSVAKTQALIAQLDAQAEAPPDVEMVDIRSVERKKARHAQVFGESQPFDSWSALYRAKQEAEAIRTEAQAEIQAANAKVTQAYDYGFQTALSREKQGIGRTFGMAPDHKDERAPKRTKRKVVEDKQLQWEREHLMDISTPSPKSLSFDELERLTGPPTGKLKESLMTNTYRVDPDMPQGLVNPCDAAKLVFAVYTKISPRRNGFSEGKTKPRGNNDGIVAEMEAEKEWLVKQVQVLKEAVTPKKDAFDDNTKKRRLGDDGQNVERKDTGDLAHKNPTRVPRKDVPKLRNPILIFPTLSASNTDSNDDGNDSDLNISPKSYKKLRTHTTHLESREKELWHQKVRAAAAREWAMRMQEAQTQFRRQGFRSSKEEGGQPGSSPTSSSGGLDEIKGEIQMRSDSEYARNLQMVEYNREPWEDQNQHQVILTTRRQRHDQGQSSQELEHLAMAKATIGSKNGYDTGRSASEVRDAYNFLWSHEGMIIDAKEYEEQDENVYMHSRNVSRSPTWVLMGGPQSRRSSYEYRSSQDFELQNAISTSLNQPFSPMSLVSSYATPAHAMGKPTGRTPLLPPTPLPVALRGPYP